MQNPGPPIHESQPRPRARRKYLRWLALASVVAVVAALGWLNGPGLRWLAPMVASHYSQQAGVHLRFTLEGSLTGGLSVKDLHLEGYKSLASLTLNRVTPVYLLRELVKGRIQGIQIDGVHAELRLGTKDEKPDTEVKQPLDLQQLALTLRSVREQVMPLAIELRNLSLNATRDGKPVITLASSSLHHAAGDSNLKLEIGALTDANGRVWPARESVIVWDADALSLDRLDPLPRVSVRDLVVRLPASGGPSAEAEIRIDDAVLFATASPGFSSVSVDLREGRLLSDQMLERFSLKLPAATELTSLSVQVEGLLPDPKTATGTARLLLENLVAGDWTVPELSLDVELAADRAALAASGQALGSAFSLQAEAPITREGGGFQPGDLSGRFHIAEVAKVVAALAQRTDVIDPAAPVPPSVVDGGFRVAWQGLRPAAADVDLLLKPADPQLASSVTLTGRWQPDQPLTTKLKLEGVQGKADWRLDGSAYAADLQFDHFGSARIGRWLAIVRADQGGTFSLTGKWQGGGELKTGRHHGTLALDQADWQREGVPSINAAGGIEYAWPGAFATRGLRIQTRDQLLTGDAKLAACLLELADLRWLDHGAAIATGSARLPVPEDFSKWRETLAHDGRPVEIAVESTVLSLALLKDWLPAAAKLDARSTGQLNVKVSGTYAAPAVNARVEARDLRSPEQPKLPPADLIVTLAGRDGRLTVDGRATAPDFPPAVMTASMPFRPAAWAEDPALLAGEKLSARVDLPRIDLARFASLLPSARKIAGTVTGNVEVAGEVGKPLFKGRLDLTGGDFELKDERYPAVTGIAAAVDLALDRVTLRSLKATVAGGTLQGGGSLAIKAGKPGAMDFRVTGNHLPLVRNDSLIIRANADLRLTGSWERAALSGTVGVVDSLFYRDIELLPIGTPFTTPSAAALPKIDTPANPAAAMPEPFRNWNLNLLARTENPFLIRGNFATGKVSGSVRIGGTLGNPAPDGVLKISDFRAALPFSTLTVRSGTARFNPATGFDPALEIRGTAEPRPYRVNVFVYGLASNPQLVLTSNPPLPDNEIMTLLATGTTTSGLENPQAASSRALQLLAEELRRGRFTVGKQLRPLLGLLDRVDFSLAEADPYSSGTFSTATLALSDHWFLSAGMGADGDSRVLGIWRLTFR